jgi:hypothetical protein
VDGKKKRKEKKIGCNFVIKKINKILKTEKNEWRSNIYIGVC